MIRVLPKLLKKREREREEEEMEMGPWKWQDDSRAGEGASWRFFGPTWGRCTRPWSLSSRLGAAAPLRQMETWLPRTTSLACLWCFPVLAKNPSGLCNSTSLNEPGLVSSSRRHLLSPLYHMLHTLLFFGCVDISTLNELSISFIKIG